MEGTHIATLGPELLKRMNVAHKTAAIAGIAMPEEAVQILERRNKGE